MVVVTVVIRELGEVAVLELVLDAGEVRRLHDGVGAGGTTR